MFFKVCKTAISQSTSRQFLLNDIQANQGTLFETYLYSFCFNYYTFYVYICLFKSFKTFQTSFVFVNRLFPTSSLKSQLVLYEHVKPSYYLNVYDPYFSKGMILLVVLRYMIFHLLHLLQQ